MGAKNQTVLAGLLLTLLALGSALFIVLNQGAIQQQAQQEQNGYAEEQNLR